MKRQMRLGLLLCSLGLWSGYGSAATFTFHKVLQTTNIAPGTSGGFEWFDPPSMDGLDVAFRAFTTERGPGIYKGSLGGGLWTIADTTYSQPFITGNFTEFGEYGHQPSIRYGRVFFVASGSSRSGIYYGTGAGYVVRVVDSGHAFPDQTQPLTRFDSPCRDVRTVISGNNSPVEPYVAGVYSTTPEDLLVVADTRIPEEGPRFTHVGSGVLGGGYYAFSAQLLGGNSAIYRTSITANGTGSNEQIVVTSTLMPGDIGIFGGFGGFQVDRLSGGHVAFQGRDRWGSASGIYVGDGGQITRIADTATPIPGGLGYFTGFGTEVAIYGEHTVFQGLGENSFQGIYLYHSGSVEKVIDTTDLIEEEPIFRLQVSREAISQGRIAFHALGGFGEGIYVATFSPPPGDAVVGLTPTNPYLPVLVTPGRFQFHSGPSGVWYDPPLAAGFEYVMSSNSLFMSILEFPAGFAAPFHVLAEGQHLGEFGAGRMLDFTEVLGHGVSRFAVTNISPAVDVENPMAFPLRIAFDTETADFEMRALGMPDEPDFTSVAIADGKITLTWNEAARGMTLQRATNLAAPLWQDLPGFEGTNSATRTIGGGSEFFRLSKP